MDYDHLKLDEAVLALLYINACETGRAWKSMDWAAMDRLCEKGLISNPKSKAKSVMLTEEGLKEAERMFRKHFAINAPDDAADTPRNTGKGRNRKLTGRI